MKIWNERLAQACEKKGISKSGLARLIGVSAPTAGDWLDGKIKNLEAKNLLKICSALNIEIEWLIDGKGEMDRDAPPPPPLEPWQAALLGIMDGLTQSQRDELIQRAADTKQKNEELINELTRKKRA